MQLYRLVTRQYSLLVAPAFCVSLVDAGRRMGAARARATRGTCCRSPGCWCRSPASSCSISPIGGLCRGARSSRSRRSMVAARVAVDARVQRVQLPVDESAAAMDRIEATAAGVQLPPRQGRAARLLDERHAGFATVFYSNEKVLSRWADPSADIRPTSKKSIERWRTENPSPSSATRNQSGAPGCWDVPICTGGIERMVANPESIFTVDDKYFVYVGANRELLTKLGFRFWD